MTTAPTPLRNVASIPLELIEPDPNNPRTALGDIDELAASMQEHGLLQPIVVRIVEGATPPFMVVAGHRRFAAANDLDWPAIPAVIRKPMRDTSALAAMLVENGQREDLDPIEEATAYKRLRLEWECSSADVARRVGKSGAHVTGRLALLALPTSEQEELRAGTRRLDDASRRGRQAAGVTRDDTRSRGHWHFTIDHPLAAAVSAACSGRGHSVKHKLGKVGCGVCWEEAIRADERGARVAA